MLEFQSRLSPKTVPTKKTSLLTKETSSLFSSNTSIPSTVPIFRTPTTTQPPTNLDQLSIQFERDKEISFLTDITQIDFQCITPTLTPIRTLRNSSTPDSNIADSFNGLDSFDFQQKFERTSVENSSVLPDTGSRSNLATSQQLQQPLMTFGDDIDDSQNSVPRVPKNTPVDALANVEATDDGPLTEEFFNELYTSAMFDDVEDQRNWYSLFSDSSPTTPVIDPVVTTTVPVPPTTTISATPEIATSVPIKNTPCFLTPVTPLLPLARDPSHPLIETRFVHEKSSAIVIKRDLDEVKDEEKSDNGTNGVEYPESKKRKFSSQSSVNMGILMTPPNGVGGELPPIVVKDPSDRREVKRARNTLAARRSREKKRMEVDELRLKVSEQEKTITELLAEVKVLKSMLTFSRQT